MSKAKRVTKDSADGTGLRYSLEDMVPRRDEQVGSRSFGMGELLKPIGAFLVDGSNRRIATPSGRKHGSTAIFEAPSPPEVQLAGKTHFKPCIRCQMNCTSTNWQNLLSAVISNSGLLKRSPSGQTERSMRTFLSQYGVEEIDEVMDSIPDIFGAWIVGESVVRSPESDVVSIHMVDSESQGGCFFLLSNAGPHQDFAEQLHEMSEHFRSEKTTDSFLNFALAAQDADISDNLHNRAACDLIQSGMFRIEVVFDIDPKNMWKHVPAGPGFCLVVGVCSDNSIHALFDAKSDVLPKWGSAELSAFAHFLTTEHPSELQVATRTVEESHVSKCDESVDLAASQPDVVECTVCVPTPALAARNVEVSLKSPLSLFTSKEYLAQTQTQSPPAKRTRQRSSANLAGTGSMVASISIQNKGGKKEPIAERLDDLNSNISAGERYTTIRSERLPMINCAQDGDDILFLGLKMDRPPIPGAISSSPVPLKGPSRKSTPFLEPILVKEDPPTPAALLQAEIDSERRKAAQKGQSWRPLKLWLGLQSTRALCDRYLNAPVPIMVKFQCSVKHLYLFHVALSLSFGEESVIHEAVPSVYFADSLSQFMGKQTLTLRRCLEAADGGGKVPFFAAQDALQEIVEIFLKEEEIQRSWGGDNVVLGESTVMLVRSPVQQRHSIEMAVTASTSSPVHAEYTVFSAATGAIVRGTALVANEALRGQFVDAIKSLAKLNKTFC